MTEPVVLLMVWLVFTSVRYFERKWNYVATHQTFLEKKRNDMKNTSKSNLKCMMISKLVHVEVLEVVESHQGPHHSEGYGVPGELCPWTQPQEQTASLLCVCPPGRYVRR